MDASSLIQEVADWGRAKNLNDAVMPTEYKGYHATAMGDIIGPSGKKLKAQVGNSGYLNVSISINGKPVRKTIHRLVATAFIPNPDCLDQVNHIDGDKTNNKIDNLEWCSRSNNMKHAVRVLGKNFGFKARPVKDLTSGESYQSLGEAAEKIGSTYGSVWAALNRGTRTRGHYIVYGDAPIDTDELIERVKVWRKARGLDNGLMQFAKVNEEVGEIAHELTRGNLKSPEMKDAIGDTLVTIIILSDILGYDPIRCLEAAYEVIKDRKGRTENGSFIKEMNGD